MLQDTTYIGKHYYNKSECVATKNPHNPEQKYRKVVKGSRIARPREEWLLVEVPAIIEPDLFKRVQERIEQNKRMNKRHKVKNVYLVGGLIECPCGNARTGDPANGRRYYRCTNRLNKYPLPRTCFEPGVNATVLDDLVWKNIEALLNNPELLLQQAERWQKNSSPIQAKVAELQQVLKQVTEEELRYASAYGEGLMPEHVYKEKAYATREKRSRIMAEISSREEELANKPILSEQQIIDGVSELLQKLDFKDKKYIMKKIVTKIIATKKEVTVWGRLPLLTAEQVGYELKYWHRRPAKRRQINPVQRPHQ